jgi:hypothetical protein
MGMSSYLNYFPFQRAATILLAVALALFKAD